MSHSKPQRKVAARSASPAATRAMRRAIESNTEEDYRNLGYYDKWIRAVRDLIIEQQVLSREEIEARVEQLRAKHKKVAA